MTLHALRYFGGKAAASARGTGRWIADLLPTDSSVYVEPFGGMAGVLLQRPAVRHEVLNDLDGRLVTWWRVLREHRDELLRRYVLTPRSRTEFVSACRVLDDSDADDMAVAAAVSTVLTQSMVPGLGREFNSKTNFARIIHPPNVDATCDRLTRVAERIRCVVLECQDAAELLSGFVDRSDTLIYCDPPYTGTNTGPYDAAAPDLGPLLADASARVAISGYGSEWDRLGWQRHEHPSFVAMPNSTDTGRVEVLWTNFEVRTQLFPTHEL